MPKARAMGIAMVFFSYLKHRCLSLANRDVSCVGLVDLVSQR